MAGRRRPQQESVYDLIPREAVAPVKPAMHRSVYPADSPPTASTFGRVVGAQAAVTNLGGDYVDQPRVHRHKLEASTFGPASEHFPDTTNFLPKHSKPELPEPRAFAREPPRGRTMATTKPAVVTRREVPVMGVSSGKNFVRANAVAVITAEAKKPVSRDVNYLEKKDFGRTPEYLNKVKDEIAAERSYIRSVLVAEREEEMKAQPKMRLLPEEERLSLLGGLKAKWEAVNKEYQTCTHIVTLDTIGKVRRKEQYEMQLHQLERSIEKLSKKYVFVGEES